MNSAKLFLIGLVALTFSACSHGKKIDEVAHQETLIAAQNISDRDYADAIIAAGNKLNWLCKKVQPGKVDCVLDVRKHSVSVEVVYDANKFSINYVSSLNLCYENKKIHSKYQKWVNKLKSAILQELHAAIYKS